jgi:hypothetical protein
MMNGVIETATGVLLRKGFCDFTNDGSFDSANETERVDVTYTAACKKNDDTADHEKWNGVSWETVVETAPEKLVGYKKKRKKKIDVKTSKLISNGFTHNGKKFSLSPEAQINGTGAKSASSEVGAINYPLTITQDDDYGYDVNSTSELNAYHLDGLGTKKSHLDTGRDIKIQVNDAVDEAAVDAITDDR